MRIYATTIEVANAAPSAVPTDVTVGEGATADARPDRRQRRVRPRRRRPASATRTTSTTTAPGTSAAQVRPGEPAGLGRPARLADRRRRRDAHRPRRGRRPRRRRAHLHGVGHRRERRADRRASPATPWSRARPPPSASATRSIRPPPTRGRPAATSTTSTATAPSSPAARAPPSRPPTARPRCEIRGAIVDRDNGRTEYTATVVVTNAAPTASIAGPQTVPSSGVVALTLTAGDPSPSDELTGVLDWGDGHTETIDGSRRAHGRPHLRGRRRLHGHLRGQRGRRGRSRRGRRGRARHRPAHAERRLAPGPAREPDAGADAGGHAGADAPRRPRAASPGVTATPAGADQRPRGHPALRPRVAAARRRSRA